MIFHSHAEEHAYRARTHTDKSTAGVTMPSFKCRQCGQSRRLQGRKKHRSSGYICKHCVDTNHQAKEQ